MPTLSEFLDPGNIPNPRHPPHPSKVSGGMALGRKAGRGSLGSSRSGQSLAQVWCDLSTLRLSSRGKEWKKGILAIPMSLNNSQLCFRIWRAPRDIWSHKSNGLLFTITRKNRSRRERADSRSLSPWGSPSCLLHAEPCTATGA